MRKFYAEIEKLDDNEIKIIGYRIRGSGSLSYYEDNPIIIYKDHIPWIIETLKAKTKKDYYEEWTDTVTLNDLYKLFLGITINRGGISHLDLVTNWFIRREDSKTLTIPYSDYNDLMESITPFISLLEDFVKKSS